MADRKPFLLRLPAELMEQLHLWAKDDLRSLNAQIEFLLREALRSRRKKTAATEEQSPPRE
ncbi:MAG: Arc family DNA-binding protein [Planctomycetota bacterium]